MIYTITYTDFNGTVRESQVRAVETTDGFYVTDLGHGLTQGATHKHLGCSKTMSPVIHWKPIRAAINDLLGGRALISYAEVKPLS